MDLLMATRAPATEHLVFAVGRVVQRVALVHRRRVPIRDVTALAKERLLGHQHPDVVRPVRVVAGGAVLGDGRVSPEHRAALLGGQLTHNSATVPPVFRSFTLDVPWTLWAGGAGHLLLAHRHVVELQLLVDDGPVTARARRHLGRRFQLLVALRAMDAVTGGAAHVALMVLAAGPERVLGPEVAARQTAVWSCILREAKPLILVCRRPRPRAPYPGRDRPRSRGLPSSPRGNPDNRMAPPAPRP